MTDESVAAASNTCLMKDLGDKKKKKFMQWMIAQSCSAFTASTTASSTCARSCRAARRRSASTRRNGSRPIDNDSRRWTPSGTQDSYRSKDLKDSTSPPTPRSRSPKLPRTMCHCLWRSESPHRDKKSRKEKLEKWHSCVEPMQDNPAEDDTFTLEDTYTRCLACTASTASWVNGRIIEVTRKGVWMKLIK